MDPYNYPGAAKPATVPLGLAPTSTTRTLPQRDSKLSPAQLVPNDWMYTASTTVMLPDPLWDSNMTGFANVGEAIDAWDIRSSEKPRRDIDHTS
jgi:hypothetical protein